MQDFRESRISRKQCPSCEAAVINGVYCHETGCPDNHLFVKRECKWCGSLFSPEENGQLFCDESCAESYYPFNY